ATGSLDKLPLLSPEFENNTIRFSLDGREKDYTPGKTYYSVIQAGGDTVLNGAQVNGNKIIADVGHDLLISSQQDTSKYDSKQT
ncbi:hemagglutinin repeat-containing protein, partial [Escherichia coli]|uniref:hemagglutinin repeat-containing protein n=1 Tax=Escherichia coli TaxID=562 RepID=UPI001FCEDED4